MICKEDVTPFGPIVPDPSEFELNQEFREFLFKKMVNGEMASYDAKIFVDKFKLTRTRYLDHLEKTFFSKKN